jgi:penicillin-binding protein 2
VFCPGYYAFGGRTFDCHKKGGHGTVNLLNAIEQSCNVYFYRMGFRVGLEHWSEYAKRFGFGEATGIDLSEESAGLVPDESYLDRRYGKGRWSKGMMLNLAIGQGDLLVTPLQMASFAMAIANEGRGFKPRLKRSILDPFTGLEEVDEPDSVYVRDIRAENWALVRRGMFLVVNGGSGTARGSRVAGLISAGKTGTAQNPHGEAHAWFIGFAPFDDPQVAFCVFIENGGSGSGAAAPIAKKILGFLLENNKLGTQPEPLDSAD